jgi:hypothetical protein
MNNFEFEEYILASKEDYVKTQVNDISEDNLRKMILHLQYEIDNLFDTLFSNPKCEKFENDLNVHNSYYLDYIDYLYQKYINKEQINFTINDILPIVFYVIKNISSIVYPKDKYLDLILTKINYKKRLYTKTEGELKFTLINEDKQSEIVLLLKQIIESNENDLPLCNYLEQVLYSIINFNRNTCLFSLDKNYNICGFIKELIPFEISINNIEYLYYKDNNVLYGTYQEDLNLKLKQNTLHYYLDKTVFDKKISDSITSYKKTLVKELNYIHNCDFETISDDTIEYIKLNLPNYNKYLLCSYNPRVLKHIKELENVILFLLFNSNRITQINILPKHNETIAKKLIKELVNDLSKEEKEQLTAKLVNKFLDNYVSKLLSKYNFNIFTLKIDLFKNIYIELFNIYHTIAYNKEYNYRQYINDQFKKNNINLKIYENNKFGNYNIIYNDHIQYFIDNITIKDEHIKELEIFFKDVFSNEITNNETFKKHIINTKNIKLYKLYLDTIQNDKLNELFDNRILFAFNIYNSEFDKKTRNELLTNISEYYNKDKELEKFNNFLKKLYESKKNVSKDYHLALSYGSLLLSITNLTKDQLKNILSKYKKLN